MNKWKAETKRHSSKKKAGHVSEDGEVIPGTITQKM